MGDQSNSIQRKAAGLGTLLFFSSAALMLYFGWQWRNENFISAEFGLGYALGIIGGSMMLLLLIYPLRKRNPSLSFLGGIKPWFKIHMMLGVLGPSAVLYHCNFSLGALNSNVALLSMLIVASSGLMGRYFYAKIHHGLYGKYATLQDLQQAANWDQGALAQQLPFLPQLSEQLKNYELHAMTASQGPLSVIKLPWLNLSSLFTYLKTWHFCKQGLNQSIDNPQQRRQTQRQVKRHLKHYFETVIKVAELDFYRRLFALWHVLHLPLFAMMLLTSIVHIIAVHMY